MVLLVFVHGYNLEIRYLQPWTITGEPLTLTGFTEYFLANGIFRFRIPMLFIISGFLFAMYDHRPYKQRAGKRFRTLFIPYLLWSALGLALTYCFELFSFGREIVADSGVVMIDDKRLLLHDYHWYELLGRWIILPVPYQLWFIRVLFIYNLAYPAIRWLVTNRVARFIFFPIAILLWLGTTGFIFVEGEGLLFFSLGIWMQKTGFNIESPHQALRPLWWGITFIVLATLKTIIAFQGEAILGNTIYPFLTLLHKMVVLSGLITCWYGLDPLVKWCMKRHWFIWLSAFSFMIYAMHTPPVAYAINGSLKFLSHLPYSQMTAFFLLPFVVIAICIGTGAGLRKLTPRIYSILTGGRGL